MITYESYYSEIEDVYTENIYSDVKDFVDENKEFDSPIARFVFNEAESDIENRIFYWDLTWAETDDDSEYEDEGTIDEGVAPTTTETEPEEEDGTKKGKGKKKDKESDSVAIEKEKTKQKELDLKIKKEEKLIKLLDSLDKGLIDSDTFKRLSQ